MFEWFKKNRINRLVNLARDYLEKNFVEPQKEEKPKPAPAEPPKASSESKVQFSMREKSPSGTAQFQKWDVDDGPKFSMRDNYDSITISRTMKNMSASTPTSRILKELDDNTNMTFVDKMLEHISKRHMRDSDVYKAAQVDRRLFSKIVSDREYKPAKDTCVAFALALRLTLSEAEDLLSRAGYTLSHSNKRDVVIEYFFKEHIYDLDDINGVLYQLDQKVIGR